MLGGLGMIKQALSSGAPAFQMLAAYSLSGCQFGSEGGHPSVSLGSFDSRNSCA